MVFKILKTLPYSFDNQIDSLIDSQVSNHLNYLLLFNLYQKSLITYVITQKVVRVWLNVMIWMVVHLVGMI